MPLQFGAVLGATSVMAFISLMTAVFWGQFSGCQEEYSGYVDTYTCYSPKAMTAVAAFASLLFVVEVSLFTKTCVLFLFSWVSVWKSVSQPQQLTDSPIPFHPQDGPGPFFGGLGTCPVPRLPDGLFRRRHLCLRIHSPSGLCWEGRRRKRRRGGTHRHSRPCCRFGCCCRGLGFLLRLPTITRSPSLVPSRPRRRCC